MFSYICSACKQPVQADETFAGKTVVCPICNAPVAANLEAAMTTLDNARRAKLSADASNGAIQEGLPPIHTPPSVKRNPSRLKKPILYALAIGLLLSGAALAFLESPLSDSFFDSPEQPDANTGVALFIEPSTQMIRRGETPRFTFTFFNGGKNEVVLVEPGDGTAGPLHALRTPMLEWSHRYTGGAWDCGNINPLRLEEVFSIAPGKSYVSNGEWFARPYLPWPGRYRVSLRYINEPDREWGGWPNTPHDPKAMEMVRRSTPVSVVSNTVVVIVTP